MKKAVYVGAGIDIVPVIVFTNITDFVYIDSKPFSEFGSLSYTHTSGRETLEKSKRSDNLFSRPSFLTDLVSVMKQNNFSTVDHLENEHMRFSNGNQTVTYYYSCAFPEYVEEPLIRDLCNCDTLILCGHDPHIDIFNYIKKQPVIIGTSHTSYEDDENSEKSTSRLLHRHPELASTYVLMKERKEFEHWNYKAIVPEIAFNFDVIKCSRIGDFSNSNLDH